VLVSKFALLNRKCLVWSCSVSCNLSDVDFATFLLISEFFSSQVRSTSTELLFCGGARQLTSFVRFTV